LTWRWETDYRTFCIGLGASWRHDYKAVEGRFVFWGFVWELL
jgi:hypothetical protein